MTTYYPQEEDVIVFGDANIFIVWNSSATFNVYERLVSGNVEIDAFTNYKIDDLDCAYGAAQDWAEDYYHTLTECCYND